MDIERVYRSSEERAVEAFPFWGRVSATTTVLVVPSRILLLSSKCVIIIEPQKIVLSLKITRPRKKFDKHEYHSYSMLSVQYRMCVGTTCTSIDGLIQWLFLII